MHRKYENVSILNIKEKMSTKDWNRFLAIIHAKRDVSRLKAVLYGLQADMSDLAKLGVNSQEVTSLFLRLQRSIEETARKIFREVYPSPLDTGTSDLSIKARLAVKGNMDTTSIERAKADFNKASIAKKQRDEAFNTFLSESRF